MPPYNTIVATEFTLPTYVFENGQVTGNPWNNGTNLLLVDGDYASSNANATAASDITVGGYNFLYNGISIPQGAVITGIELEVIGYRGAQTSPVITLDISLYDNTNGADDFYPYISGFTGLTETVTTTVLGTPTYLFASSFTVDQINNLKINLQANGDINLDSFLVRVYFYIPAPSPEPEEDSGVCIDCESPIQVQAMFLELPFLSGETKFYLKKGSFAYPNGVPVQPGDAGSCGGKIPFVFDEGKKKADGNFEENAMLDTNTGSWTVLPSGVIEVDLGDVTQRGLDYKTPGTHAAENMSDHDANSKVIISNSVPYLLTLVRRCQEDIVFSPPIDVLRSGATVVDPVHTFDFLGNGVEVIQDPDDPFKANITIAGAGTTPPVRDTTSSETSGSTQVPDLTWEHTCNGVNRALIVQISMESGKTVTSVTYNGDALTHIIDDENGDTRSEIWYMIAPDLGTHDIVVTFSSDSYCSAGASSWVNVDQSSPIGDTNSATGTSLAPSVGITTMYDNSVVIDGLATAQTPILLTPGAGQIENWHEYAVGDARQGASSYEPSGETPDSISMDYTITQNTDWTICAIELRGIVGSGGDVTGTGTDNHVVRWNGTGVPVIQDSVVTISDAPFNVVKISSPSSAGTAMGITLQAGDSSTGNGALLILSGGDSTGGNGNGGDVFIHGGAEDGSGTPGYVHIRSGITTPALEVILDTSPILTTDKTFTFANQSGIIAATPDPNANTIYVWDDTDGLPKNAALGTGLSYNHGTHTLSVTGFVDLISTQIIAGLKTFTDDLTLDNNASLIIENTTANVGIEYHSTNAGRTVTKKTGGNIIQTTNATTFPQFPFTVIALLAATYHVHAVVTAVNAAEDKFASWEIIATITSDGASSALLGTATVLHVQKTDATWDVTIDATGTNDFSVVVVNGSAETINWGVVLDWYFTE